MAGANGIASHIQHWKHPKSTGTCYHPGGNRPALTAPVRRRYYPAVTTAAAPPPTLEVRPRIVGYDLARALAILGMFLVHFPLVMARDLTRPASLAWVPRALDGRAAATFVVLA